MCFSCYVCYYPLVAFDNIVCNLLCNIICKKVRVVCDFYTVVCSDCERNAVEQNVKGLCTLPSPRRCTRGGLSVSEGPSSSRTSQCQTAVARGLDTYHSQRSHITSCIPIRLGLHPVNRPTPRTQFKTTISCYH